MSPIKKLNCIKRVLAVLISNSNVDASMPAYDGDVIHVSGGIECRDEGLIACSLYHNYFYILNAGPLIYGQLPLLHKAYIFRNLHLIFYTVHFFNQKAIANVFAWLLSFCHLGLMTCI